MRLIDADKLRKDILDLPNCYNGFSDAYDKAYIIDVIDEQPTVDIDAITASHEQIGFDKGYREGYAQATVDAEPVRHGHWTSYEFATNNRWRKCSVCGTADEYINEYGTEALRRYCPFCGAKMDGERREDANKR